MLVGASWDQALNLALRSGPRPTRVRRMLLIVVVVGTIAHMLLTAWAAPVNFSQRDHTGDLDALTRVFNQFALLNLIRAVAQTGSCRFTFPT
jgi:hypothetical protein